MRNRWGRLVRLLATVVVGALVTVGTAGPVVATDYGASYTATSHPDEHRWAERATVARIFEPTTLRTWDSYPQLQRAYDGGVRKFAISWKGTTGQEIRDFAATVPDDVRVFGAWWHEPENDIEKGEFTLAKWRRTMVRLCGVMRENDIVPVRILMGWTLYEQSGRDIRDYRLPRGTITVSAFDGHVVNKPARGLARRLLAEKRRSGLPLAVPETSGPASGLRTLRTLLDGKMRWGAFFTRDGMSASQANAWFGPAD